MSKRNKKKVKGEMKRVRKRLEKNHKGERVKHEEEKAGNGKG